VIPNEIIENSIYFSLASAYTHIIRGFEAITGFSQTRLLIMFLFRNEAVYNQNQLAVALRADRTVVHRVIKTMIRDGLLVEKKEPGKRQIKLRLTAKGEKARWALIEQRVALDKKLMAKFSKRQLSAFIATLASIDQIDV
jgi:DNA-binding MarR family transcriptional regulator